MTHELYLRVELLVRLVADCCHFCHLFLPFSFPRVCILEESGVRPCELNIKAPNLFPIATL